MCLSILSAAKPPTCSCLVPCAATTYDAHWRVLTLFQVLLSRKMLASAASTAAASAATLIAGEAALWAALPPQLPWSLGGCPPRHGARV